MKITCSLVVDEERADTALEMVVYFCPLPTTKAPDGALVRTAPSANEASEQMVLTSVSFILERKAA